VSDTLAHTIAANLATVRSRVERAARESGRDPAQVHLIAISKTFDADAVRAAAAAGQRAFGENRVQEALPKIGATRGLDLEWHLVGHLQSNKARKAVGPFACIQSIDSLSLLQRLDNFAIESDTRVDVLVQVDLAREGTKFGAPPADSTLIARAAVDMRGVRLRGLMLLPPFFDDPEQARPYFQRLREFRDELVASGLPADALAHLSMGMSHDFEVAIAEGATMVRVGTAIFGSRA
jgi:pyridoxal phosphate enzyme (YggS family)